MIPWRSFFQAQHASSAIDLRDPLAPGHDLHNSLFLLFEERNAGQATARVGFSPSFVPHFIDSALIAGAQAVQAIQRG
jgi:hypothetical protein